MNTRPDRILGPGMLLLLLGCCSCGRPEPTTPDGAGVRAMPVTFETRRFERSAGACGDAEEGPCARFVAEYPEIATAPNQAVVPALNREIREMLLAPALGAEQAESLEARAMEFLGQWRRTREEFPQAASVSGWFVEHRVEIVYQDYGLISLESGEQAYTGGAHPNASSRFESLDLTDGLPITLDELVAPGHESMLDEIAERRFRALRKIPSGQSLADAGYWFDDHGFAVNDNFAVVEQGLLFYFNSYEIGPYAAGPTELVIPREALGEWVLPGGPLDRSP